MAQSFTLSIVQSLGIRPTPEGAVNFGLPTGTLALKIGTGEAMKLYNLSNRE